MDFRQRVLRHQGLTLAIRSPAAGMALVVLGAVGAGLMPLFARSAYADMQVSFPISFG